MGQAPADARVPRAAPHRGAGPEHQNLFRPEHPDVLPGPRGRRAGRALICSYGKTTYQRITLVLAYLARLRVSRRVSSTGWVAQSSGGPASYLFRTLSPRISDRPRG